MFALCLTMALVSAVPTIPASARDAGMSCANAVDIGFTVWEHPYVKGSGSWTRCDNTFSKIEIGLFKQVVGSFYDSEEIISFDPADFGSHEYSVVAECSGNANWFTTIAAYDRAGEVVMQKSSNYVLANCG
jgi:hypothetical protein